MLSPGLPLARHRPHGRLRASAGRILTERSDLPRTRRMIVQEEIIAPPRRSSERKPASKPLSVCLLISSLEFGGAERQVVEMTRTFDRTRITPFICSLSKEV